MARCRQAEESTAYVRSLIGVRTDVGGRNGGVRCGTSSLTPSLVALHSLRAVTPEEVTRLAASGAVAGLCPTTEANLGDGLFPAVDYLRQGGVFGIGSDSHISVKYRRRKSSSPVKSRCVVPSGSGRFMR